MYECFEGLKPSECECMNCTNGFGKNQCLGTTFTPERYSHKKELQIKLKIIVNYFSFSYYPAYLNGMRLEWCKTYVF